jgi:hypothetical protein
LLGIPALPFAVGIYLPVAAMTPVFVGGCLRALTEWMARRNHENVERRTDKGVLLGSGLIAGEGLLGVAVAIYAVITKEKPAGFRPEWLEGWDQALAAVVFLALCWFLVRSTRPTESEG